MEIAIDETKLYCFIKSNQKSFVKTLQNFVREKYNLSHIEDIELQIIKIYKNARISRQYFSKICKRKNPTKKAIIRLGLSLKLPLEKMTEFLKSSGYSLGVISETDLVVRWCVENEIYDVCKINVLLKKINIGDTI